MDYIDKDIVAYLKKNLTQKRLKHVEGVVLSAEKLCQLHGEDPDKARCAALFHDMFRSTPVAMLNMYVRQLNLGNDILDNPNLSHSKIAACVMKKDYGIEDEDIINAVSYHTTGRAGMSKLEKIVFLADAIEEGRQYPGVDEIRALALESLDKACLASMKRTVEYVSERGEYLHKDTLAALEDLIKIDKGEI